MKKIVKFQNRNCSALLGKSQKGVTLIEAMVALLIFSVGALGLAALQLTAVAASGDNQQRTLAIWKAQEFADRIRSNPTLRQLYVDQINNQNINTIGIDNLRGVIDCGNGDGAGTANGDNLIAQPGSICADTPGANAAVCTNNQKVAYDVWDVFCEPSTGAAVVGGANVSAAGSVGLTNLEVALIDNQAAAGVAGVNGNDMLLYFEWVSREADAAGAAQNINGVAANAIGAATVNTNLCDANVAMETSLDAYCLRFSPY